MTIFDAENLILAYRSAPVRSPLAEHARIHRLIQTLRAGLPSKVARDLYKRLGGTGRDTKFSNESIWDRLFDLLDRRPALGLVSVTAAESPCERRTIQLALELRRALEAA